MGTSLFMVQSLSGGAVLVLAALALIAGGVVVLGHAVRMRREEVERRVNLVLSRFASGPAGGEGHPRTADSALLRDPKETAVNREAIRRLTRMGISARRALLAFTGLQLLSALCLGLLAFLAGLHFYGGAIGAIPLDLIAAVAGIVGWLAPSLIMTRLVKRRRKEVDAGLAEALELLVICAEAGLALGDGIDRIVDELKLSQPALSDELALTSADLKILPSREQALNNFAERIDLPGVRSLVTTLGQTMRYGTPLAQAMRVVAAEMRNEALIRLEERANRLPALLTVPMMLFILPTIFLVVGGPAAIKLLDAFGH